MMQLLLLLDLLLTSEHQEGSMGQSTILSDRKGLLVGECLSAMGVAMHLLSLQPEAATGLSWLIVLGDQ